jgi:hypothetical protein
MAATNFDKVVEMAQALDDAEKWRLRDLLDVWLAPPGPPTTEEEEVEQEMLRDGILDHVPPPITDTTPWENRRLIEVKGKPLSETIMEERR